MCTMYIYIYEKLLHVYPPPRTYIYEQDQFYKIWRNNAHIGTFVRANKLKIYTERTQGKCMIIREEFNENYYQLLHRLLNI